MKKKSTSTKPRALKIANNTQFNPRKGSGVTRHSIKHVMIAMIMCSPNGVHVHRSQDYIAEVSGYSVRQVRKVISWLKRNGELWVTHKYIKGVGNKKRRGISRMHIRAVSNVFIKAGVFFGFSKSLKARNASLLPYSLETGEIFNIKPLKAQAKEVSVRENRQDYTEWMSV